MTSLEYFNLKTDLSSIILNLEMAINPQFDLIDFRSMIMMELNFKESKIN